MSTPLKVLQLTDLHLMADPKALMVDENIQASFDAVINLAEQHCSDPDLVIITGDMSHDEEKADYLLTYSRLAKALQKQYKRTVCIPGNHDNAELVKRIFPLYDIQATGHFQLQNWQFILLDSSCKGTPNGHLTEQELTLLDKALASRNSSNGDIHSLVITHHPVFELDSGWIDKQSTSNAEELFKHLSDKPNVQGILCGHAHQAYERQVQQIKVIGSPATCPRQFKPLAEEFAVDEDVTAGFRCLTLHSNGEIETAVFRL